ncbi:MAG: heparinase II/III family protein, partial [Arthrobacter sp.]
MPPLFMPLTITEDRAALREEYYAAKQSYEDARATVKLLPRGQTDRYLVRIAASAEELSAVAKRISAAQTAADIDAARAAMRTATLRATTAKKSAANLKIVQDLRLEQIKKANLSLDALTSGNLSAADYKATETRAVAFSTLLSADTTSQLASAGTTATAPALKAQPYASAFRTGSSSIPTASGWVGFPGGCALPAAEGAYRPQRRASGPSVAVNSEMVNSTKARMLADPNLKIEHERLLRSAASEVTVSRDFASPWLWYSNRVLRLGYGWLAGGNVEARDKLRSDTSKILLTGPNAMDTNRASVVLTSAATAGDWTQLSGSEDVVLVKWLGPQSCLLFDQDSFVTGPTNLPVIHNTASFVAAAYFLGKHSGQATALAKATLTNTMPALKALVRDGGTQEGPQYWNYQSAAVATLYSSLPNLYATVPISFPSLSTVSTYAMNAATPDGVAIAFADSAPAPFSPLMPAWDAYSRGDSTVSAWVRAQVKQTDDARLLWWWSQPAAYRPPTSKQFPYTGLVALHQNGVSASLKGGNYKELKPSGHQHLDFGSFTYFKHGLSWVVDPGPGDYSLPGYFSGTTRWTYWKPSTAAHSTIMQTGTNHPVNAAAAVKPLSGSSASVDLSEAIPGSSAVRTLKLQDGTLSVNDKASASVPLNLTWQVVTDASVTVSGNVARLSKSGKVVTLTFRG